MASKSMRSRQPPRGNDTAEHKRGKRALWESEERFRALIENSLDAIVILDADGTISYESPSVERLLGYTAEELTGKGVREFLHPEDVPSIPNAFDVSINNSGQAVYLEVRFLRKDGSWRVFEGIGNNLLHDPRVKGIVVNFRDVTERKQAEEELRIKESALENSINAIAMTDMDGKITYVNQACMKLWGSPAKEELVGKPYWVILQSDEVVKDVATAMSEKQTWEGQIVARRKDGKEVHVQVATSVVRDAQGNPIQTISSFVDITEKREAEKALRESEEKFRRFVEEMSDGYCVVQGTRIVFANARSAEMFGYTTGEVTGKTIRELLPPEIARELVEVHTKRRRGERTPSQYETTLTTKKGTERPVEFGVSLTEYAGKPAVSLVVRDVSERRQMEEALRESEVRFRTIFEGAAISMALVGVDGKPLAINPALQRMLGYSPEEFSNMLPSNYLHPEDAMVDEDSFMEMVSGKRDNYQIEKRYIRKDGEIVWANQTLSLVRDAEGRPQFVIAMMEDISGRKRAEEERQRLEERIQLAGRLAAVGELAAGVAHELNNPLAAVQAFAQLLASRDDMDETVRADLETIYREAQRATKITGNLLSFARRHKPEKRLVSINEILEKSLELHAYQMKLNSIELIKDLDPDLPVVMADPHQMHQVFVNIIRNAEHAITGAHGAGNLLVKTERAGEMIRVTFADDGIGISGDDLRSIFDPFFTTKDVGEGTGLGLSICYGIVEGHGGRIYAKSNYRKGATFVVETPIYEESV